MMRMNLRTPSCVMLRRLLPVLAALVCVVMLLGSPATAQINDPSVLPENIELPRAEAPILHYALAGGFLLASLAIGFKPSKRAAEQKK